MKYLKTFEEKNWISDAIKKPGSLRKSLKKKKGEKISKSEIESEISKLKKKDKDPDKEGIQGLNKKDSQKYKRLNLAKTLKKINENFGISIDPILIALFTSWLLQGKYNWIFKGEYSEFIDNLKKGIDKMKDSFIEYSNLLGYQVDKQFLEYEFENMAIKISKALKIR